MAYKELDETVVDTATGNFNMLLDVPEELNIANNQDGSTPEMSLKVTAETLRTTVQVMVKLQDEQLVMDSVLAVVLDMLQSEDLVPDTEEYAELRAAIARDEADLVYSDETIGNQFVQFLETYKDWTTTTLNMRATGEDGVSKEISLETYTPGFRAITFVLNTAASPEWIDQIILRQMPLDNTYTAEEHATMHYTTIDEVAKHGGTSPNGTRITPDSFS